MLAVAALVPVRVQQGQEQLEVLLLARMRRRCHQQQMPGDAAQELPKLVTASGLQLTAEVMRGHPVRLIYDDDIPVSVAQVIKKDIASGELVHPRVDEVGGQDLETKAELIVQLVLPLVDQAAGDNDQAPAQVNIHVGACWGSHGDAG